MKNNFYTVLPSNSCPLTHPNNKASKFIVEFENPMYLNGNWEVALLDFTFIYNAFPIYSNATIQFISSSLKTKDISISIDNKLKKVTCNEDFIEIIGNSTLHFKLKHSDNELGFTKIEDAQRFGKHGLIIDINDFHGYILEFKDYKNDDSVETINLILQYSIESNNIFYFNDYIYMKNLDEFSEYITSNLSSIFKDFILKKNEMFQFVLKPYIKSVTFDPLLVKTLGLDGDTFTQGNLNIPHNEQVFKGVRIPKLFTNQNQMFIYSNIVEPVIVGDVNVPLLKSVWLDKYEEDELVQIIVRNPMYLPISTSCINNIEINIRDDVGQLINFAQDAKTHLTLHFRKVNE